VSYSLPVQTTQDQWFRTHTHAHTHTQHLNVTWRNCLDVLGFLNTKIWYVGCIYLCLMWNTSDPSKCKSSYLSFVQYSPVTQNLSMAFSIKLFYLVLLTRDIFLQNFLWLFFLNGPKVCNLQHYCRWTLCSTENTADIHWLALCETTQLGKHLTF